MIEPKDRIIVALDTKDLELARQWAQALNSQVGALKVGLEFFWAQGPEGVRRIQEISNLPLFIDTKLADIPATMVGAASSISQLHPWMFSIHAMAGEQSMRAARDAAVVWAETKREQRPLVMAVTVLTSMNLPELLAIGIRAKSVKETVVKLAMLAQQNWLDGVIASPLEIEAIRQACGQHVIIVTPGIRLAGAGADDQTRLATPYAAIQAGADYLVIGRPITAAPDPVAVAQAIAVEIAAAKAVSTLAEIRPYAEKER